MEDELLTLTTALVRSQDQLLALAELAKSIHADSTLDDAARALLDCATRVLSTAGSAVYLAVPDQSIVAATRPAGALSPEVLQGWLTAVQAQNSHVRLSHQAGFDHILLLPLSISSEIHGILALANPAARPFQSPERILASTLTDQAGHYFDNIVYREAQLAQVQLQTELDLASDVQARLQPRVVPAVNGVELWASSQPARTVGGDLYTYHHQPDDSLRFAVGDVSGKGFPAALLMAMLQATTRSTLGLAHHETPDTMLQSINCALYDDFTDVEMFATLLLGCFEPATRTLRFANAGHSPVIHCPAGGTPRMLEADGVPVGVLPDCLAGTHTLQLNPGDTFVVLSDGFPEAESPDDAMFGYERLLSLVGESIDLPAAELGQTIITAVQQFANGRAQSDDQTVFVLKGQI